MKERDKFLTEVMGECWHEWDGVTTKPYHDGATIYYCKCGDRIIYNPHESFTKDVNKHFIIANDFSTWEDFGKLWGWCEKQVWWIDFQKSLQCRSDIGPYCFGIVNPDKFADAIYKYIKEEEKEK